MTNLPDPLDYKSMKGLTLADIRKLRAAARKQETAANAKLEAIGAQIAEIEALERMAPAPMRKRRR